MTDDELIELVRETLEPEQVWPDVAEWSYVAQAGGWINPEWLDQDSYDKMGEQYGLRVLTVAQISNYHDDNHHAGAVLFCEDPLCKAVGYAG